MPLPVTMTRPSPIASSAADRIRAGRQRPSVERNIGLEIFAADMWDSRGETGEFLERGGIARDRQGCEPRQRGKRIEPAVADPDIGEPQLDETQAGERIE